MGYFWIISSSVTRALGPQPVESGVRLGRVGYPYGPPGPALPREFRMAAGGFGRMAAPFIAMLVFFFAIMLLLSSIFGGLLVGIPVAVVATGALVGVLYSKFTRLRSGTVVRFSEYGVELSDQLGGYRPPPQH